VLVGLLTGVGIQVFTGQIPDMLGIPKGTGNWFEQQWSMITHVGDANGWTVAFAAGTLVIILGFKRFLPKVPGAVVAVILSIILSNLLDASTHGVAVVGSVEGGFSPLGLPEGIPGAISRKCWGSRSPALSSSLPRARPPLAASL
jgi:MFS superfamily sulfate permease-like transporter